MFLSLHISSIFLVFLGTLESFEKPYALCPMPMPYLPYAKKAHSDYLC